MPLPKNLLPTTLDSLNSGPFVHIVEQPTKSIRYRYIVEGRRGTIAGISSTRENRTPFTIKIADYIGRVTIVISCVTQNYPHQPHPHGLSGPNCKNGYYALSTELTPENRLISFPNLAIQCVKKNAVEASLRLRQQLNLDPFNTGFDHCNDVKSIDLNVLRLCVQVFLEGEQKDFVGEILPVVSEPIYNKKTMPDPVIYKLSSSSCCIHGNINGKEQDIVLLCTKVMINDIQIRFFEVSDGRVVWQDYGRFEPNGVFNNTAICFRPPRYYNQEIRKPVKVLVQLVRPSDDVVSPAVEFEYLPLDRESDGAKIWHQTEQNTGGPFFGQVMQHLWKQCGAEEDVCCQQSTTCL